MNWLRFHDYLFAQHGALMCFEGRGTTYPEGDVSEALARAAACQDDSYERMLLGKRPDFA